MKLMGMQEEDSLELFERNGHLVSYDILSPDLLPNPFSYRDLYRGLSELMMMYQ